MLPRHYLLPLAALSLALAGCSGGGEEAAETKPAAAKPKGGKPHVNPWAKEDPNAAPSPAPAPRPKPKPTQNPWAKDQPAAPKE